MSKAKSQTILLSLLLGLGVLLPLTASAQFDWLHGLFGKGSEVQNVKPEGETELEGVIIENPDGLENYENFDCGLFKRGESSSNGLFNQGFGEVPTGITIDPFDDNSPLGNGLFVLLLSGAGYAALKKKKTNESNQ
ncbi:MAG: hypothetical protein J6T22_00555 [Bacteroidales bacterium]|nr:hypothetical protein [Bacteroidales bacterium]